MFNEEMAQLKPPVSVLSRDDIAAMNVLRSTRSLGIKVPEDLALVGTNDSMPYCYLALPKLTSVKHPGSHIGYQAARAIDRLIRGKNGPNDPLLESPGIAGMESTNIIAVEDELATHVLTYIRQHARKSPTTSALAVPRS